MDSKRVEPTIYFMENIPFSLKLFSGHSYGQSFIKTVRGPYIMIVSLKSETVGKLINIIPDSCLLMSTLPGSALRTHVESLGKPCDVNKGSQSLAW